jgi:hypothetical protein
MHARVYICTWVTGTRASSRGKKTVADVTLRTRVWKIPWKGDLQFTALKKFLVEI